MTAADNPLPFICVAYALLACLVAAGTRAGKPFTLAELLMVVALCAVFLGFTRLDWLHSIGIQALLLATFFAASMTRAFGTQTTFLRHMIHWLVMALTEVAGAFILVNLIYAATSGPPGDAFSVLFAMLGAVPFFAGLLVLVVVAALWPIRWSRSI